MDVEPVPPSGRRLHLFLSLEQASFTRAWRVHLVALASLPLAAVAAWPDAVPELGRRAVWVAWLLSALAAGWSVVEEWRLERRVRRAP